MIGPPSCASRPPTLRVDRIGEYGGSPSATSDTLALPLARTGHTAIAFADDPVAVWRIEIGEGDRTVEARADRTDLDLDRCLEPLGPVLFERLAAGDALPQTSGSLSARQTFSRDAAMRLLSGYLHRFLSPSTGAIA